MAKHKPKREYYPEEVLDSHPLKVPVRCKSSYGCGTLLLRYIEVITDHPEKSADEVVKVPEMLSQKLNRLNAGKML